MCTGQSRTAGWLERKSVVCVEVEARVYVKFVPDLIEVGIEGGVGGGGAGAGGVEAGGAGAE